MTVMLRFITDQNSIIIQTNLFNLQFNVQYSDWKRAKIVKSKNTLIMKSRLAKRKKRGKKLNNVSMKKLSVKFAETFEREQSEQPSKANAKRARQPEKQ